MTDNELNRAVARATGETVSEIRSRGFSLLQPNLDVEDVEAAVSTPTTKAIANRRHERPLDRRLASIA